MDLLTDFGLFAPLIVSLFAVWLGFLYQKRVLDREKRREAYLQGYATLLRMTELIQHQERASFLAWSVGRILEERVTNSADALRLLDEYPKEVASIASLLGLDVDFLALMGENRPRSPDALGRLAGQIQGRILFEEEQLRQRFNLAQMMSLSATRMGVWRQPRRSIAVMNMEATLWGHLERVFFAIVDASSPRRVDWNRIDTMMSELQSSALEDLGITDHMSFTIVRKRDPIAWSPDVLVADPLPS